MNFKKTLLIIIGSMIGIVIVSIAYITVAINPNDYKDKIKEQVKITSGHDLVIDGEISWRFFPTIGVTVGHTSINNTSELAESQFMQFQRAQIDLAFWPLLNRKLEIGIISIHGLAVHIDSKKQTLNKSEVVVQQGTKKTTVKAELNTLSASDKNSISGIVIKGVEVIDASIQIDDKSTNSTISLDSVDLTLGLIELGKTVPLSFSANIDNGEINAVVSIKGLLKLAEDFSEFSIRELKSAINVNAVSTIDIEGDLTIGLSDIPQLGFQLKASDIDLDAILNMTKADDIKKSPSEQIITEQNTDNIDLSFLQKMNVDGQIDIDSIKVNNVTMSAIKLPIQLNNGQLKLEEMKGNFYQGQLTLSTSLDARKPIPEYRMKTNLMNVQALPLFKDLADTEIISGKFNLTANINGKGIDPSSLKKNSQGKGDFNFIEGAFYGANVADLIRTAYATFKGEKNEPSSEPLQTDFASFTGDFTLGDGVVNNTSLNMQSPMLRIKGNGKADLITETINYQLKTALVGTLKGQGGEPINDLKKLSIPLIIKGPLLKPKVRLDMKDLLEDSLMNKVKDKLKSKFNKLFGK